MTIHLKGAAEILSTPLQTWSSRYLWWQIQYTAWASLSASTFLFDVKLSQVSTS
jgi:hypothetical protein